MLNFGDSAIALLPDPDALGIEAADRLHLLGLYSGILAGEAPEPEVEAALPVGHKGTKKKLEPRLKPISMAERRREWRAHISAAEQRMQDIHTDAGRARRKAVESERPKESVESQRAKTRTHKQRGLEVQKPTFEKQESPQGIPPKQRERTPRPVPTADERLEASNRRAAEVREENRFQAHLKATEGIVRSQNIKEEKRQRTAEKDIGYTPTQIKRDRASRKKLYEQRTSNMVNLEKAKRERARIQAVEEINRKEMQKRMKKVRAAKKRKKK